jgi:hypothetical protein
MVFGIAAPSGAATAGTASRLVATRTLVIAKDNRMIEIPLVMFEGTSYMIHQSPRLGRPY